MVATGPWQSDLADLGPQTITINREDHPSTSDPSEPTAGWEDPSFAEGVNVHRFAQRGYTISSAVPGGPGAYEAWNCCWSHADFTDPTSGQFWNGDPDSAGYTGAVVCRALPSGIGRSVSGGTSEVLFAAWSAFRLGNSQINANHRFSAVTVDYERVMQRIGPSAGLPIPTLPDNAIGIEWEDDYADWSDLDVAVTRDEAVTTPGTVIYLASQTNPLSDLVTGSWGPVSGFLVVGGLGAGDYDFDTFEGIRDWWTGQPPYYSAGLVVAGTDVTSDWTADAIPSRITYPGQPEDRYTARTYLLLTRVLWNAEDPFQPDEPDTGNDDDGGESLGLWVGVRIVATAQRYRFLYAAPPVTRQWPRDSYGMAAAPRLIPPPRTNRVVGGHH